MAMFFLSFSSYSHKKKIINLLYERIIVFYIIGYCLFVCEVLPTDLMILLKYNN